MKTKTLSILLALVAILSISVGVFAADFTETWDENTVLTVFNDLDLYFPDLFSDIDSDFLWVDNGPAPYPSEFISKDISADIEAKAPAYGAGTVKFEADPCGDGLVKFTLTLTEDTTTAGYYKGDSHVAYITEVRATNVASGEALDIVKCSGNNNDGCHSVKFKKQKDGSYQGKLTGYIYLDNFVFTTAGAPTIKLEADFTTYLTTLWKLPASSGGVDYGTVTATDTVQVADSKRDYCQDLQFYSAFGYKDADGNPVMIRAKYDENTGEARLQAVIRNYQPKDYKKTNYVIPADIFASYDDATQRITDYTCKYTVFNTVNSAPRTDYCKYGEGIAIAPHSMVRLDISIDHLSGAILRAADGKNVPFTLRIGGLKGLGSGYFEPVDYPCPVVSRMLVKDPLYPFMSFFKMDSDKTIEASGAYGVYEGGLWGIYQKCGKFAYMAVRLMNDGTKKEVINLDHVAVAVNGGTPMSWNWVLTSIEADGNKIELEAGDDVILIGRAKVTDIPSQLNADTAMTGAVNFTDYGFYITGKVYSDHNNTNCVAAPK